MKRGKRWFVTVTLALAVAFAAHASGASESGSAPGDGRLRVVATTSILGDVVANVVGDVAQLTTLMAAGENPHSYEVTPSDLRAIEMADVIFLNGFDLEEGLVDTVESAATGVSVEVSEGITPLEPEEADHEADDEHDHHGADPHVWMDPENVLTWLDNIAATLESADPANAATYRENAEAYAERVRELDALITAGLGRIPESERRIIVDHQAFTYFAAAYGFEVVGAVVPDTDNATEPSARGVARLVELIREEQVRAIFVGRSASEGLKSLASAISEEAGGEVRILETLTGSLAQPGDPGDSYLSLMEYNLRQILLGLGES